MFIKAFILNCDLPIPIYIKLANFIMQGLREDMEFLRTSYSFF